MRGGSWNNNPNNLRGANRNRNSPDNRNNNVGVRLVVVASHNFRPSWPEMLAESCTARRPRLESWRGWRPSGGISFRPI
ncbi:MAG: hypothetical protein KDE54_10790 [Caldilineaceae bacterium]|nr:hypothetical protein [Caldilineaceae bacterium]MCB0105893.1 hypothetical protein [Caldilineaceae bacterium]MCB0144268.1 hypothetical protein [Caldilineaceae bacterium]